MISEKFGATLFEKMQESATSNLDSKELEILEKLLCNEVMIKALGQAFAFCKIEQHRITTLDMSAPGALVDYTRGQGRIDGIAVAIMDLINLIVEKDDEDDSA